MYSSYYSILFYCIKSIQFYDYVYETLFEKLLYTIYPVSYEYTNTCK